MGVVYLGRDPVIGRLVALKTIRAVSEDDVEQREYQERFLREAQAAGILSHPNIVTVHDVGEDASSETSFIAMEYVEGKNLKQLVSDKTVFTFERIAEIIGQAAEALDYAHRRGIVHRDVKPANIIITPEGQVKITDFGIAKIEKSNLTTTGQFLGTPNYMSPEQVTGDAIDGRSDLFSLGVVLYELLTRKKPFTADNLTSISYKIVHERFVPPETYDAAIPSEFVTVLEKALAKDPAERFQRGNDFALALYEFKAREEERQMLRDLGQMVAEAEKLGPVATVTAPPSPLPPPGSGTIPQMPAVGRSPFEILAATPASVRPSAIDDLATREVSLPPLPATAFVPPPAPPAGPAGGSASSEDWQLDEPTRSRKAKAPAPPAPPAPVVDVEASLPGAEVVEVPPVRSAPAPPARAGLAVSPLDDLPADGVTAAERPEGATEILLVGTIAPPAPGAPAGADRPTEILQAVAPPPALPAAVFDRPTEILRVVPPPTPAATAAAPGAEAPAEARKLVPTPPPVPPSPGFVAAPEGATEILKAIVPPPGAAPAVAPRVAPPVAEQPTELLLTPVAPSVAAPAAPAPADDEASEKATERIADAMKLAMSAAQAARPAPPPLPTATAPTVRPLPPPAPPAVAKPGAVVPKPVPPVPKPAPATATGGAQPPSRGQGGPAMPPSPAKGVPPPGPPSGKVAAAPEAKPLPPVELAPIPEPPAPAPPPPAGPLMKRSVNARFVALILALVVVAGGVVTGLLWAQKRKIDAQAAVDEVREREVKQLKALMDEGEKLLAAGRASEALTRFREVVRRKPDSAAARAAIARAEEQARAAQTGAELAREVETRLAAARDAAEKGEHDRALDELAAVLLLQPENGDALVLRESVTAAQAARAAEDKKAAALARRKKPTPVPTPVRETRVATPVDEPKPATPTPGSARLRIVFQSPAPEGYVMVRRNDREVFRRNFDFGRKSAGGLVEGTIEVPSGPASFKAWAIPTNRSFNGYEAAEIVVPGGQASTLLLELNASKKLVLSLR